MSDLTKSIGEAIKEAEANGFEVIYGDNWHLLLDFDNDACINVSISSAPKQYYELLEVLNDNGFHCREEARWPSKSNGLHVVVKLGSPLHPCARLALQAALGSDPKRELLGVLRVLNGVPEPSMLFRPKGAVIGYTNRP